MTVDCITCGRPNDDAEAVRGRFAAFMNDEDTNHLSGGEWGDWTTLSGGATKGVGPFGEVKLVVYDTSQVFTDSYGDQSGTSYMVLEVEGVLLRQDMVVDSYGGVNPKGRLRVVHARETTVTVIGYEE